jgi:antibiotic biosynthesis monooxygenase (ABM) superfamily enzyme
VGANIGNFSNPTNPISILNYFFFKPKINYLMLFWLHSSDTQLERVAIFWLC